MTIGDFSDRDWYGAMDHDAAMLGDREAERRRFDHEDGIQRPATMNMTEWMRERAAELAADPAHQAKEARLKSAWAEIDRKLAEKSKRAKGEMQ